MLLFVSSLAHSEMQTEKKIDKAMTESIVNNQKRTRDERERKKSPNLLMVIENLWSLLFAAIVINIYPWV